MTLDPLSVPENVRALTPLAERWGIVDDAERADALEAASDAELREISDSVSAAVEDLEAWLAGVESESLNPSDAYVAFTCLMMAMYSADRLLTLRRP
jgi:hypothetical protein